MLKGAKDTLVNDQELQMIRMDLTILYLLSITALGRRDYYHPIDIKRPRDAKWLFWSGSTDERQDGPAVQVSQAHDLHCLAPLQPPPGFPWFAAAQNCSDGIRQGQTALTSHLSVHSLEAPAVGPDLSK